MPNDSEFLIGARCQADSYRRQGWCAVAMAHRMISVPCGACWPYAPSAAVSSVMLSLVHLQRDGGDADESAWRTDDPTVRVGSDVSWRCSGCYAVHRPFRPWTDTCKSPGAMWGTCGGAAGLGARRSHVPRIRNVSFHVGFLELAGVLRAADLPSSPSRRYPQPHGKHAR